MEQRIQRTESGKRTNRKSSSRGAGLLLALPLLIFGACGGSSSGGGSPTRSGMVAYVSQALPSTGGIYLALDAASNENRVVMEVRASNVEGLSAVFLRDLGYPGHLIRFVSASPGDFLGPAAEVRTIGNDSTTAVFISIVEDSDRDRRQGVDGSGVLARVEFDVVAGGTGSFAAPGFRTAGPQNETLDYPFVSGQITIQR